jgi:hypothetical protein
MAIANAQATTLERANKHVRYPNLKIGQKVLKRRHVFRTFVDRKWNKKYDGPFTVIAIISPTIYKIQRDADSTYVDIVHASYLKPYRLRKHVSFADQLVQYQDDSDDAITVEPEPSGIVSEDTFSDTLSDLTISDDGTDYDSDNDDLQTADSSFSSDRSSSISSPVSTSSESVTDQRPSRTAKVKAQAQISSDYHKRLT